MATITPDAPTAAPGGNYGVPITTTGTLTGYTTTPTLTYSLDGGVTSHGLPGVTPAGWSAIITQPQFAGNYTLLVSDGTVTGSVTFAVVNQYTRP